jgi:hypothetical protein
MNKSAKKIEKMKDYRRSKEKRTKPKEKDRNLKKKPAPLVKDADHKLACLFPLCPNSEGPPPLVLP